MKPDRGLWRRRDRKAFSLIEMLVVSAVVVVLVAILLPVLDHARERARITACATNLRQWYYVYTSYASDYKEFYGGVITKEYFNFFTAQDAPYNSSTGVGGYSGARTKWGLPIGSPGGTGSNNSPLYFSTGELYRYGLSRQQSSAATSTGGKPDNIYCPSRVIYRRSAAYLQVMTGLSQATLGYVVQIATDYYTTTGYNVYGPPWAAPWWGWPNSLANAAETGGQGFRYYKQGYFAVTRVNQVMTGAWTTGVPLKAGALMAMDSHFVPGGQNNTLNSVAYGSTPNDNNWDQSNHLDHSRSGSSTAGQQAVASGANYLRADGGIVWTPLVGLTFRYAYLQSSNGNAPYVGPNISDDITRWGGGSSTTGGTSSGQLE